MGQVTPDKFANLTFEDFRRLAEDKSLSKYERIGFPDSYRAGKEELIFADILRKVPNLTKPAATVLDIGPGCSDLPRMIIQGCQSAGSTLVLVDSAEMLSLLPDGEHVTKVEGRFPRCAPLLAKYRGQVDAIVVYSVFHYIFVEENAWRFLDECLALLAEGGQLLIGDIPNVSKRRRFFASRAGVAFHRQFTGDDSDPEVRYNELDPDKIDDSVVLGLMQRARAEGFDAYLVPQSPDLPMANRREDLLVVRP